VEPRPPDPTDDESHPEARDDSAPKVPTLSPRCPGCARRIGRDVGSVLCGGCGRAYHAICWRTATACTFCGAIAPKRRSETDPINAVSKVVVFFDLPAPKRPVWLDRLALVLLLPILGGVGPMLIVIGAMQVAKYLMIEEWIAGLMATGATVGTTVIGLTVLVHRFMQYRRVIVDEGGVVLGRNPKWPGERIPWPKIQGFRIVAQGVMLKLQGNPLGRWFGPIVHCEQLVVHDLVVLLEKRGVFRLE
jgi:hypothetical protein